MRPTFTRRLFLRDERLQHVVATRPGISLTLTLPYFFLRIVTRIIRIFERYGRLV